VSGPGSNPYLRRPAAPSSPPRGDGLADVLERVLDKGLVIAGDIQISLLDIELITIKVRLLLASADTAQQMGIDWWKHDPFLSGRDRELAQENAILRDRVDQLEAAMGAKLAPGEPSPGDLVGEGADDLGPTRGQLEPSGSSSESGSGSSSDAEPASDDTSPVESEEVTLEPASEGTKLEVEEDEGVVRVTAAPDLESYTKAELQDALRERDLPVSGNKDELIARLQDDL
jgi:hypothetical protein